MKNLIKSLTFFGVFLSLGPLGYEEAKGQDFDICKNNLRTVIKYFDPDGDGFPESIKSRAFVRANYGEKGQRADTLVWVNHFDINDNNYHEKVVVQNAIGVFNEEGKYLGRKNLLETEAFYFNTSKDAINYYGEAGLLNENGYEKISDTTEFIDKGSALQKLGRSRYARVNGLEDCSKGSISDSRENIEKFLCKEVLRHSIID